MHHLNEHVAKRFKFGRLQVFAYKEWPWFLFGWFEGGNVGKISDMMIIEAGEAYAQSRD